ncbi:MAG: hypothetical protein ABUK01_07200 [Leptospirales bacterium]
MNKKIFSMVFLQAIIVSAIILPAFLYGYAEKKEDPRIIEIRNEYKIIEQGLKIYKVIEKQFEVSAPGEGSVKYYYKKKELVKIHSQFHGDGISNFLSLYYVDGVLFFAFEESETFPIWEGMEDSTGKTEHRLYFENNKMFRWIVKSFEDKMLAHYQKEGTKEFIAEQKRMLKKSVQWRAYEASEIKNFDEFSDI